MKVGDLVAELLKLPQHAEVVVGEDEIEIDGVYYFTAYETTTVILDVDLEDPEED